MCAFLLGLCDAFCYRQHLLIELGHGSVICDKCSDIKMHQYIRYSIIDGKPMGFICVFECLTSKCAKAFTVLNDFKQIVSMKSAVDYLIIYFNYVCVSKP